MHKAPHSHSPILARAESNLPCHLSLPFSPQSRPRMRWPRAVGSCTGSLSYWSSFHRVSLLGLPQNGHASSLPFRLALTPKSTPSALSAVKTVQHLGVLLEESHGGWSDGRLGNCRRSQAQFLFKTSVSTTSRIFISFCTRHLASWMLTVRYMSLRILSSIYCFGFSLVLFCDPSTDLSAMFVVLSCDISLKLDQYL